MRLHLISIGGSAMHNLAIALKNNGNIVTGSDDEIFEPSKSRLKKYGLLPEKIGWNTEKITPDIDIVILGMHARKDNPELLKAINLGLKIVSYPEFLYYQSVNKIRVVIAGSHGKTTITAMVMHVLNFYNRNFDFIVGSKLKDFEVMVRLSNDAPIMVFEGDEYLSSPIDLRSKFLWYKPHIALISGIAWDHINVFPSFENYLDQFFEFADSILPDGKLIYNDDDKYLKKIVIQMNNNIETIPYSIPNYEIIDGVTYLVTNKNRYPLQIFGEHNLTNLNGARKICNSLGINDEDFYRAITSFQGADNRLTLVFKKGRGRLFKDFAHAPSKVKATLKAVKQQFPEQKIVVGFELHTFSSLNASFLKQYTGSLDMADAAFVYFNPHALELKRLPSISTETVKIAFNKNNLMVFNDSNAAVDWLKKEVTSETVLLMMSSGNFNGLKFEKLAGELFK